MPVYFKHLQLVSLVRAGDYNLFSDLHHELVFWFRTGFEMCARNVRR